MNEDDFLELSLAEKVLLKANPGLGDKNLLKMGILIQEALISGETVNPVNCKNEAFVCFQFVA